MLRPEDKWEHCRRQGFGPSFAKYWIVHGKCEVDGCRLPSWIPVRLGEDFPLRSEFIIALCESHRSSYETVGPVTFAEEHHQFLPKIRKALKLRST
jgi:hypothetical protein